MRSFEALNFVGKRFGRLKILKVWRKNDRTWAKCRCNCKDKTIVTVRYDALKNGHIKSCKCLQVETGKRNGSIQGKLNLIYKTNLEIRSPEYNLLSGMKQRTTNSKNPEYKNYGGRGITVHKPWLSKKNGHRRFLKWLESNEGIGRRPSKKHSLDRIDNDGNYEPGNLQWANAKQQVKNRRSTFSKNDALTIFLVLKDIKHIRRLTKNESKIYYNLKKEIKLK